MVDLLKAATTKPRKFGKRFAISATKAAQQNLIQDVQDIEHRAHSLGLHVTGHALNRAKNALGWEIAGDVEQAGRASRDER